MKPLTSKNYPIVQTIKCEVYFYGSFFDATQRKAIHFTKIVFRSIGCIVIDVSVPEGSCIKIRRRSDIIIKAEIVEHSISIEVAKALKIFVSGKL